MLEKVLLEATMPSSSPSAATGASESDKLPTSRTKDMYLLVLLVVVGEKERVVVEMLILLTAPYI